MMLACCGLYNQVHASPIPIVSIEIRGPDDTSVKYAIALPKPIYMAVWVASQLPNEVPLSVAEALLNGRVVEQVRKEYPAMLDMRIIGQPPEGCSAICTFQAYSTGERVWRALRQQVMRPLSNYAIRRS
jgi:hypothetical protein